MPREGMRGADLDWDRELCKKGCREWLPWYRDKKGKVVYGCRVGGIPRWEINGWCCREHKAKGSREVATVI